MIMIDNLKTYFKIIKVYFKPTLLFIFLALFISLPIFYISQTMKLLELIYIIFSYFISIIALSISFYVSFGDEWKSKIRFKTIIFYIFLHQFMALIAFQNVNDIIEINGNVIFLTSSALYFGILIAIIEIIISNFPPFIFSNWIFRNFSGKAATFEKNISDPDEFDSLIKLLSINDLNYTAKNNSTVVYANPFYTGPTYFLKLNEDKNKIEFQISRMKGYSFIIDEKVQALENILISLGFESKGEDNIHNKFFNSAYDYPRFAKANKLKYMWSVFGILSIVINKIAYENDYLIFDYFAASFMKYYNVINEFAKENTIIVFILGIIVTILASKIENIKSFFTNCIKSFKEI